MVRGLKPVSSGEDGELDPQQTCLITYIVHRVWGQAMQSRTPESGRSTWTLMSNHGQVLLAIGRNPEPTPREVAVVVGTADRRAHRIVGDRHVGDTIVTYSASSRVGHRDCETRECCLRAGRARETCERLQNACRNSCATPAAQWQYTNASLPQHNGNCLLIQAAREKGVQQNEHPFRACRGWNDKTT